MEGKSLRAIVKELGVSHSYLIQVINGKRPASEKVLTTLLTSGLLESDFLGYNNAYWQRSSGVEQRTHKPLVGGSNPPAATFFLSPNRHFLRLYFHHKMALVRPTGVDIMAMYFNYLGACGRGI